MRNYNEINVIGGEDFALGSIFDNFDLLFEKYCQILFYTLDKGGITYSTNRNGLLAKTMVGENGFVNYVQPSIGKWDFNDEKLKRNVSPDFVLYLFNNMCLSYCFNQINFLGEPTKTQNANYFISNGVDLDLYKADSIIKTYEKVQNELHKSLVGEPNNYDQIPKWKLKYIEQFYLLLQKITNYSSVYAYVFNRNLHFLELQNMDYDHLSEKEKELVDDGFNYDDQFYPSLGCFNNFIRKFAIKNLYKMQEQRKKYLDESNSNEVSLLDNYQDPISVHSCDDYGDDLDIKIDYSNSKEFDYDDRTKIKINHI